MEIAHTGHLFQLETLDYQVRGRAFQKKAFLEIEWQMITIIAEHGTFFFSPQSKCIALCLVFCVYHFDVCQTRNLSHTQSSCAQGIQEVEARC